MSPARRVKRGLLSVVLIGGVAVGCAAPRPASLPDAVLTQYSAMRSVAILPPQVDVYSVAVGGMKEHQPELERQLTSELLQVVTQQFTERGRTVKATPVAADGTNRLFRDVWLRETYELIHHAFHGAPRTIEPEMFGTNLGDQTEEVARELGSDGLVFVECHVEQRTGGSVGTELATKMLVGVATAGLFVPPADPAGTIVVDAVLVDGKSGMALWGNSASDFKMAFMGAAFDESVLDGVVKNTFRTMPTSSPS